MSNETQLIEDLKAENEDLKLRTHACEVAITALSVVINGLAGKQVSLSEAFTEGLKTKAMQELTNENPEYFSTLHERINKLLAKP
ncbi:hypothetical protein ABEG61_12840 [Pantoea agglomerans]|uniref:hypothetical protein n=1 Tax=Enterobacter agglomerans TaxID=549 RepID=UPI00320A256E